MDSVRQALQQRRHLLLRQKGPLQVTRKLRQSEPHCCEAAVRNQRNWLGRVRNRH
jgi:hypothetical protein